MNIPQQYKNKDFRFCLIKPKSKAPFEKDWTTKNNYRWFDKMLREHIESGGNFGIIGGFGNLVILDKDSDELKIDIETFAVKTGSGGVHFYLFCDYDTNHVFINELGELRAKNYQVVGIGSIHPNGKKYEVLKDLPIKKISKEELKKLIEPYIRDTTTAEITDSKKDDTRSGLEYRRAIAEFRKGKSRKEVFEILMAYKKFADGPEQYRQHQLNNAEDFVLQEQENKIQKKEYEPNEDELDLLKNPKLFEIIINEFDKKIEGEEKSKKAIFLSLCSIYCKDSEIPLNSLVSSESSAGKSFICKNIIKIFPKELVEYRTKITPEAFTYWKSDNELWNWDGKICYLEDITQTILDAPTFKVMCSEGSTATIVQKQKAVDIEIQGKPVMLVTTARTNPNTEILNRFQIISLDETKEQTRAIIFRQAKQNNHHKYNEEITNALRGLRRKNVKIPYAPRLAEFLNQNYNFDSIRLRRDFSRLLDLIKCSAVLHQYQRKEIDSETIEANEQDYFIAREVINYIQTATFKGLTHKLKKAFDCCKELGTFTAKEVHAHFPIVNQKMWYNYLDDLCERKMLTAELRKTDDSKKQVTYFRVNEGKTFSLPDFTNLPKTITNVTLITNDTIVTNLTNDETNVKNVRNVLKKSKKERINSENFDYFDDKKMKGEVRICD